MTAPPLSPEQLERLRELGLSLDRAGTFWHAGVAVTHARLRQALLRWLDVRVDGRDILRLDPHRYAYVAVEDAHLRARAARWDDARCFVLWDDEQEAELDYGSLRVAADHALYASVRGRLRGRIAGPAQHAIVARVIEQGDGFALVAAGRTWPIAPAARP